MLPLNNSILFFFLRRKSIIAQSSPPAIANGAFVSRSFVASRHLSTLSSEAGRARRRARIVAVSSIAGRSGGNNSSDKSSGRRAAAAASSRDDDDDDDDDGEDGWELDDSPGLDDADDEDDMGDEEEEEDPDAAATSAEQARMTQSMLAISPPVLRKVDPLSLLATEYTPLAYRVRWLRFPDLSVIAPIPRDWAVFTGAGRLLGVPLRTYVACWPQGIRAAKPVPTSGDDDADSDGDDDGASSDPLSAVGGGRDGPESHSVGLTVTSYRGALGSQLLAGAHGSPRDVATFFTQLHMMRRAPEGLVRQDDFRNRASDDDDAGRSSKKGSGGRTLEELRSALDRTSGDTSSLFDDDGNEPSSSSVDRSDSSKGERRPEILSSWQHTVKRENVMPALFDSSLSDEDDAYSTDNAAFVKGSDGHLTVRIPSALGPASVLGGAQSASPSSSPASLTFDGRRSGGKASAAAVTMHAPKSAVLARSDPIHIFGLEYEMKSGSAAAASSSNSADNAASGRRDSDGDGISASAMRFSVSLIVDPASDTVTEVTFAAPSHCWQALWEGDRSHPDDEAAAQIAGMGTVTGRQLLDSVTLTSVPPYHPWWSPSEGGFDGAASAAGVDDSASYDGEGEEAGGGRGFSRQRYPYAASNVGDDDESSDSASVGRLRSRHRQQQRSRSTTGTVD